MPHSLLNTLNRRARRAVASFYGSAVPARARTCKAQTHSRRHLDGDSIHRRLAKQVSKDEFPDDLASCGRGTDTRSAPGYTLVALREYGDAFAEGCAIAADAGAGTLV